jgi:hypothetical protein
VPSFVEQKQVFAFCFVVVLERFFGRQSYFRDSNTLLQGLLRMLFDTLIELVSLAGEALLCAVRYLLSVVCVRKFRIWAARGTEDASSDEEGDDDKKKQDTSSTGSNNNNNNSNAAANSTTTNVSDSTNQTQSATSTTTTTTTTTVPAMTLSMAANRVRSRRRRREVITTIVVRRCVCVCVCFVMICKNPLAQRERQRANDNNSDNRLLLHYSSRSFMPHELSLTFYVAVAFRVPDCCRCER